MTFQTLQNRGQLLLGFNYKLTRGHITSPRGPAYYSRISEQRRPVAWAPGMDTVKRRGTTTLGFNQSAVNDVFWFQTWHVTKSDFLNTKTN